MLGIYFMAFLHLNESSKADINKDSKLHLHTTDKTSLFLALSQHTNEECATGNSAVLDSTTTYQSFTFRVILRCFTGYSLDFLQDALKRTDYWRLFSIVSIYQTDRNGNRMAEAIQAPA